MSFINHLFHRSKLYTFLTILLIAILLCNKKQPLHLVLDTMIFQLHFLRFIIFTLICRSAQCQITIPNGFGVEFWDAMSSVPDKIPQLKKSPTWHNLERAYNTHVVNNLQIKSERIPNIIHQIWIGSPFPEKHKAFQKTWLEHHPDWQYILWTDKEIKEFGLTHQDMYDAASNYGAKSDIARYEILYRLGGLYIDTDFECLKPFDIFHESCDLYAGAAYYHSCTAFIGIIGCIPGHPIIKECLDSLDINQIKRVSCAMDILQATGPAKFSSAVNKHLKDSSDATVIFPCGYFYPWPHYQKDKRKVEQIRKWVAKETFAIHHWQSSWNKAFKQTS